MGKAEEQAASSLLHGPIQPKISLIDRDKRYAWGWRGFKPFWLQWLNSPKWFLFFLGLFSFLQGMAVHTFVSVSLPTLEKRFSLTSKMSGFIMSSNDITALILVVFVSFFGSYGHKTKWLGGGAIVTGLSCLLFTLPQLLAEKYDPTGVKTGGSPFCERNATSVFQDPECRKSTNPTNVFYMIFILAQLLAGAGTTPLHTLGPAWLDENVAPRNIATYLALFYISVFLGPGIGSIIGGQLLTVYVDITMPPGVNLTPAHPNWVGAWWIGPFSCGFILMVCGVILLGFPRHLPGADAIREDAIKSGHLRKQDNKLKGNLKDIIPATKALFTNGTYIFQNLGVTASAMVGFGIGPFIFKFLGGRYGASPLQAGIAIACLLIPGAALGIGFGSFLVKKLGVRRSCRRAAKFTFLLQLVGIWGSLNFLIPGCEYSQFAGVDVPYHNSTLAGSSLASSCNTGCRCSESQFRPVCDPNGVDYMSPCYAGCSRNAKETDFKNCSCVPSSYNVTTGRNLTSKVVTNGSCRKKCPKIGFIAFCIGSFVIIALGFSNAIPSKIVTLRSVPDNQRAYGLGIQFVFMRTLGALPGPVIIGTIIDNTCTLWKKRCGQLAYCLNYDYNKLGWIITTYGFPPQTLSLLFYFLSFYFSKDADPDVTMSHAADEVLIDTKPALMDELDTAPDLNENDISLVGQLDEDGHTIV